VVSFFLLGINEMSTSANKDKITFKEKVALLKERINRIPCYRHNIPDIPETAAVKKARETLENWNKENEAHKLAVEKRWLAVRNAATEFLVLEDFEGAIAVIRKHEESEQS